MSCTRGAHRGPTGSSTTSAPCWQGSILQQRMLTLLRSCCIPLQVSLLLWPCPAMALLCRAFMALPCHDAALRCPALPCPALPYPALPCHGCALTDQFQERSGICIAFVHVLGHPWCNRGCFAGHAAVMPLLHAMMCLHSFIHPSDRLSIHASFAGSCIRSFSRLPVRPSMHPSIHAYIHPFIHSFIPPGSGTDSP